MGISALNVGPVAPFVFLSAAAGALGIAPDLSGSHRDLIPLRVVNRPHRTGVFGSSRSSGRAVGGFLINRYVEQAMDHVVLHPFHQVQEHLPAFATVGD